MPCIPLLLSSASVCLSPEGWARQSFTGACALVLLSMSHPRLVFVFSLLVFESQILWYKIAHQIPLLTLRKLACFPRG